jgi:hypothetical protein
MDQVVQLTSWDAFGTYLKCIKKEKRDLKSSQEQLCFADGWQCRRSNPDVLGPTHTGTLQWDMLY